jgi:hypothetical protein
MAPVERGIPPARITPDGEALPLEAVVCTRSSGTLRDIIARAASAPPGGDAE